MNEEFRAELLERADRDQAAHNSLPPQGSNPEKWQKVVAPVDEANIAWLRAVVTAYGWPGYIPELWTVRDPEGLDERCAALGLDPNTRIAPASCPVPQVLNQTGTPPSRAPQACSTPNDEGRKGTGRVLRLTKKPRVAGPIAVFL